MLSPFMVLKTGVSYLLGKGRAGRNVIVFPGDVFLVSYMRSGNTWSRFLIGNLIHPDEPVTFANVERIIPDIYVHPQKTLVKLRRPRYLKSHEPFDPRYKKVIYIVRDPRDVAASLYRFEIKRRKFQDGYSMDQFAARFLCGEIEWPNGSWGENVASWIAARGNDPNFLLLRYEDMIENPERELGRVARFLEIQATEERLQKCVELSSADRMRDLEDKQRMEWVTTRSTRQDIPFVGAATTGSWKGALPPAVVEEIEGAWWPIMRTLGYEPVTSPRLGRGRPIVKQEVWNGLATDRV